MYMYINNIYDNNIDYVAHILFDVYKSTKEKSNKHLYSGCRSANTMIFHFFSLNQNINTHMCKKILLT